MKSKRRLLGIGFGLAVLFCAAVAAYPYLRGDMETRDLNDAVRRSMPDKAFISLSDGYTHYEIQGPESGPPVVLIHGMTGPSFIWDDQFKALADAGFRVLRYDLYGRGYSDRPRVAYDAALFDRQLLELLDGLKITRPVDVVGLSLGGAITIQFVDRHPDRVRRFVLFAPAGFPVHVPTKYRVMHWPLAGEWLMKALGDRFLSTGITHSMKITPERARDFERQYIDQMYYRGHKRALLSTLRNMPMLTMQPVYERVGALGKKGLLFWGTEDHVIAFEHHRLVQAAIPNIEFQAIEGYGHTLNYDAPEKVNPLLIEFLQRPD